MNTDTELFKKLVDDEYFNSINVKPIKIDTDLVLGNLYYITYYFNDVVETVDEHGDIIEIPQVYSKSIGKFISFRTPTQPQFLIKYTWDVNKGFKPIKMGEDKLSIHYSNTAYYQPQTNTYMIYDIDLIKQKINSLKNNAKLNVVGKFTADDANTATSQVLTNPDMKSYISNFGGKRGKHRKTRKLRKIRKIRKHGTRRRKYYKYKK
jgi:hypothetical protein